MPDTPPARARKLNILEEPISEVCLGVIGSFPQWISPLFMLNVFLCGGK
jgi:hypothetical protein